MTQLKTGQFSSLVQPKILKKKKIILRGAQRPVEYEEKIRFLLLLRNLIFNDFEEAEHLAYLEPYPYHFKWAIKADIYELCLKKEICQYHLSKNIIKSIFRRMI